ncbi:DNA-processing protein DprA [Sabulicella glaciei]|uniref:DNA-processing protein DprA n=1 Tax=Sabulicella glaciei TaxID=2984948 RepID=A0ABT3NYR6_9PROT|nr:DNA-processing protein DprA [Roseococcus sp. MDT2-1-1]MCW8087304.1 DNA-processing protein DprA [Roseococcus sp. MDT2-1-1]
MQRRLLSRHGSAEATLEALGPRAFSRDAARREVEALERRGARLLFPGDPDYPPLLALLDDAPQVLAVEGSLAPFGLRGVALVGARNASAHGCRFAEELAEALALKDIAVISGLAHGIDGAAHVGALRTGTTVACIAGGLDVPYPRENAKLQRRIVEEGGAVVSEAPLGTAPLARHFPRRNRIVAGLSLGVVVVEAARQSGTLITARLAIEAGREIFAVPGHPHDPRSHGANDLIRQGAHLTEGAEDVLMHLPDAPLGRPTLRQMELPELPIMEPTPLPALGGAAQVLEMLGATPMPVDELGRRCQLSRPELAALLTDLELEGRIETLPGNRVALAS